MPALRTDIPAIDMDGNCRSVRTVDNLMGIACRRINMTDIAGPRDHNANPLGTGVGNSKPGLLLLAVILPDDSPRTMVVNRGTLTRIPDERHDRKGMIGRPIEKVLRIRLGRNRTTRFFVQPIAIGHKRSE